MTARRIVGTEVEYGISVPGDAGANPMILSAEIVNAYATSDTPRRRPTWDFVGEDPLADARGFDVSPGAALDHNGLDPSDDPHLANVVLTNGARLYVDHAHPEYSAPEVTNPRDAVIWDKAGERIMEEAARRAATVPGRRPISLYKNNTDNKGASYGTHENYLVRRSTAFERIVAGLTPFFVSRQVVCGSGRVGIGQDGRGEGFQISSRADFFEAEVGLETTLKRPIINTRDEPHADAGKYRRLHVIVGDANMSEISTFLKIGTTSIVLDMIENGTLADELSLRNPVAALHEISHDATLERTVELHDGSHRSGVQLQRRYFELADAHLRGERDEHTREVMDLWDEVLSALETDPMVLADRLDWVAKLRLLNAYRERDRLGWASPRLQLVDLQYSDVRRDKGLYHRLVHRGSMRTLIDPADIDAAVHRPPLDTRAYFRGECIRRYGLEIAAASWDSLVFDVGGPGYIRVPLLEPERGTQRHVEELLRSSATAHELIDRLGMHP